MFSRILSFKKMLIGSHIVRLDTVQSTNDFAARLLDNNRSVPEGTVVITQEQTAGKGTDGRKWLSEKGRNLTFSVILYPVFLPPSRQFYLNKAISLAVCCFAESVTGTKTASIKWPNDVYIENGKVAGILIYNVVQGGNYKTAVVGIGVNINQIRFEPGLPNPLSLRQAAGVELDLENAFAELLKSIDEHYNMLQKNRGPERIDELYQSRLYRFGQFHLFRAGGTLFRGKITGVDRYGKLLVETKKEGVREFDTHEVEFIPNGSSSQASP